MKGRVIMWLLMTLIVYAAIGGIVWMAEDIRFMAGWREFIAWPLVVIMWINMAVEKIGEKLDKGGG